MWPFDISSWSSFTFCAIFSPQDLFTSEQVSDLFRFITAVFTKGPAIRIVGQGVFAFGDIRFVITVGIITPDRIDSTAIFPFFWNGRFSYDRKIVIAISKDLVLR